MEQVTCRDCKEWVEELVFAGCSAGGSFPAHCPWVCDPNKWKAKDCKQFNQRDN